MGTVKEVNHLTTCEASKKRFKLSPRNLILNKMKKYIIVLAAFMTAWGGEALAASDEKFLDESYAGGLPQLRRTTHRMSHDPRAGLLAAYRSIVSSDQKPKGWDAMYDLPEAAGQLIDKFLSLGKTRDSYHSDRGDWLTTFHFISMVSPLHMQRFKSFIIDVNVLVARNEATVELAFERLAQILVNMPKLETVKIFVPKICNKEDALIAEGLLKVLTNSVALQYIHLQGFYLHNSSAEPGPLPTITTVKGQKSITFMLR